MCMVPFCCDELSSILVYIYVRQEEKENWCLQFVVDWPLCKDQFDNCARTKEIAAGRRDDGRSDETQP